MPFKKLTPEELADTDTLIRAIERKDRRFRLFQTLFMIGTFVALIIIISAQQRTLDGVRDQLNQAKNIAAESADRSQKQQDTILRRLDCMTVFFSQRDRTNLTIENIDQCTLNRDGDIQKFFVTTPNGDTQTTKTEQQSDPKANSTPLPSESAPTQPITPPTIVEPRPPIEVPLLHIPLCIPLTGLCIR